MAWFLFGSWLPTVSTDDYPRRLLLILASVPVSVSSYLMRRFEIRLMRSVRRLHAGWRILGAKSHFALAGPGTTFNGSWVWWSPLFNLVFLADCSMGQRWSHTTIFRGTDIGKWEYFPGSVIYTRQDTMI